jgi:hypothetical protein
VDLRHADAFADDPFGEPAPKLAQGATQLGEDAIHQGFGARAARAAGAIASHDAKYSQNPKDLSSGFTEREVLSACAMP